MAQIRTGYSGKPLHQKLGVKKGDRVALIHAPAAYFDWLELKRTDLDVADKPGREELFVHLFLTSSATFEADLKRAGACLAKAGSLWVSWRKGKADGITDETVRAWALRGDLVDVKVCSVSAEWSGLKLVYRKELRA